MALRFSICHYLWYNNINKNIQTAPNLIKFGFEIYLAMKQTGKLWIFLFLFLLFCGINYSCWLENTVCADYLTVHFIDVGYGDSIFVEFPHGGNMLVDGGNQKAGIRVADYLKRKKVKRLDLVVVTHPHPDHIEGLFPVVRKYKIGRIIANEDISESKNYLSFFKIIREKGIEFKQVKRGDIIDRFKEAEVEIFHPDKLTGDWNNDSLVMKLTYRKVSFLFTSDIGKEICDELAGYYNEKLKSSVLKAPYHGKSASAGFIRKVSPELAVVSVGPSMWGGPSQEALAQYENLKVPLLRTDEKGTVVIKTDGEKLWF